MLLGRIGLNQLNHVGNVSFTWLDPKFESFYRVFGLFVLFGSLVPKPFAFVVLGDDVSFLNRALAKTFGIGVHFTMSLSHDKGFLLFVGQNRKLNSFLPVTPFLSIVRDHHRHSCCRAFVSQYFLRLLQVIKIVQVHSNHIFPRLSILICLLCLLKCVLWLLGPTVLDQNCWWLYFLHQRSCLFEHFQVQVKSGCLFIWFGFFVELGSFKILFQVFAHNSDISKELFVLDFSRNIESPLDVT